MEINYVYTKKRAEFGRQCMFGDSSKREADIKPVKEYVKDYILKDPVTRGTQFSQVPAEHELNTIRAEYTSHSMNHVEGGWPRDINPADEEQTLRFRKKMEKDDMYIHTVLQLTHAMEHCMLQNNALNIYEEYFAGDESVMLMEHISARTVNVFRDPSSAKRPVSHLSWSPEGTYIAVSHCNLEFQRSPQDLSPFSYIWEVDNPNKPFLVLKPPVPVVCLEYNPKDPNNLVGGLHNGQVAFWDVRKGSTPVEISILEPSHRDPVHNVLWISSKSGTEFFSSSTDGQVKWWDIRKISEPTETLILDIVKGEEQQLTRALGASCLEYEPTIPTRFMVGTENGCIINCNRKGKTPAEKLVNKYSSHAGPIYALQRNQAFVKNFLVVGDWNARIWSEDCKESSIIWTSFYRDRLTDGGWSPTRYSVFFVSRMDGVLDVWDILQQQREALLHVKVCDDPLRCLKVHEQGQLVVVGNTMGTSYIVEFSENLSVTQKNDKALLTAMLERESHREKILEARAREIRLKQRTQKQSEGVREEETVRRASQLINEAVIQAETEFFNTVKMELTKMKETYEAKTKPEPEATEKEGEKLEEKEEGQEKTEVATEAAAEEQGQNVEEASAAEGIEEKQDKAEV